MRRPPTPPRRPCGPRDGLAMVVVLLTLLALFVLCAPFLLTVRNADAASAQNADRREAELALDTAARVARARLRASHPALDPTPYVDGLDELRPGPELDPEVLDPSDPGGTMLDFEARDASSRIDLNSAPPHLVATLLGAGTLTVGESPPDGDELRVLSTEGFPEEGFLWVEGELVGYTGTAPGAFAPVLRGLGASYGEEGEVLDCGPRPPTSWPQNRPVLDQRALAIALWRTRGEDGTLRTFDAVEQVEEAAELALAGAIGRDAVEALAATTTTFAGLGAGPTWQRAVRVTNGLEPGLDCTLAVDDARRFNPGTTVLLEGPGARELGLVRAVRGRAVVLDAPVASRYEPYEATLAPLARRPVNVNTAPEEVLRALVLHVGLRGDSGRISRVEADRLVRALVELRPFDGFEDLTTRLVLPAGGFEPWPDPPPFLEELLAERSALAAEGEEVRLAIVDEPDARALLKLALDANDAELDHATMPFAFTSTDVHALELRAAVHAPSGVQRAAGVREQVELVVPQRELLAAFARQEDLEEALRRTADAPGWTTGPHAVARFDPAFGSSPPTRARAYLGPHDTQPALDPLAEDGATYVFPARDEEGAPTGWALPWAHRVDESGDRAGRMLHFDHEARDPEGRYLPDAPLVRETDESLVGWVGSYGLQRPLSFSTWVKPRALEDGTWLLDVGGPYTDSDRISLLVEDGELVLRALDAAGDHPETPLEEATEVRAPLGPGGVLPLDVWSHVDVAVHGTRPDQVTLLVDGRYAGETPGLTRLTGAIGPDSSTLPVESTDGFPDPCVLRIGNELVEATVSGPTSFTATYATQGPLAGFGGRLARSRFEGVEPGLPQALLGAGGSYPAGTTVQLYGYALPLASNVPPSQGALAADLGIFAVGRVVDAEDLEPVVVQLSDGTSYQLGFGLDPQAEVELELESADPTLPAAEVMRAFSPQGGYAALLSVGFTLRITSADGVTSTPVLTTTGARLGGVEVVHYSGWQGTRLLVDRRGDLVDDELEAIAGVDDLAGRAAFVFDWTDSLVTASGQSPDERLVWQTKVIPISLPVANAQAFTLAQAQGGGSSFVQLTRVGAETQLTEWVRYDEVAGDQLVRSSPTALREAHDAAQAGVVEDEADGTTGPGPGVPGGPGGGVGGPGGPGGGGPVDSLLAAPPPPPPPAPPAPLDGAYWHPRLGEEEDAGHLVARAVRSRFQFRGVLGTYPHPQPAGTPVLPVWRAQDLDVDGGLPGRLDPIALVDADPTDPAFPAVVHRAHRPLDYTVYAWDESGLEPVAGPEPVALPQSGFPTDVHVALQAPAPVPLAAGTFASGQVYDSRLIARVLKFPSGELPRGTETAAVGGSHRGGGVPSALVDEVLFGGPDVPSTDFGEAVWGAPLVLLVDVGEEADALQVAPDAGRLPALTATFPSASLLDQWPAGGGLVRVGDELLAYEGYDAGSGTLLLAPEGRGLLGTDPQPHVVGETVALLPHWPVTTLAAAATPESAALELASTEGFPPSGLARIGDELVHYTRIEGTALGMPSRSEEPGARDERGAGLFRGRFGTQPAAHAAGTPVILHPFRYWDRWAERADAPEVHRLGLSVSQPSAFWVSSFWDVEDPPVDGPRLGALVRTDPALPWDAAPEAVEGLELHWDGLRGGDGVPLGDQSDRVEWRFFVRHDPGSFDPVGGLSHGWKVVPRLRVVGLEYLGPGIVLRRVER